MAIRHGLGRLRHRVIVEALTETQDDAGQMVKSFSTTKTVWASIEPLVGREFLEARASNAEMTHRIRMRHFDGLTNKHRLSETVGESTRYFNITSVQDVAERGEEHVCMCVEDLD